MRYETETRKPSVLFWKKAVGLPPSFFSLIAGATPELRILTALYDLFTSREFIFSICIFVDALVAIYKIRVLVRYVLVRYVCTRYVCTPSPSPPLPSR